MIFHLFRRTPGEATIARLYGMIVAQARAQAFYRDYGVPDTVNGRFEMVVLHTCLLLRRLDGEPQARPLGQAVFDRFCLDMDDHLREFGVGDLAVPRKMQKIGEAFFGRQKAYGAALDSSHDEGLVAALARNVFGAQSRVADARRLAAYVRAAGASLARQETGVLGRGEPIFPDPERISAGVGDYVECER